MIAWPQIVRSAPLVLLLACADAWASGWPAAGEVPGAATTAAAGGEAAAAGARIYHDGVLPSGAPMRGLVQGDIALSGQQVTCGWCHRRSGLGATEGQEVVPAVTGDILYAPLRTPTSKPPLAPVLRPPYTDATLKRAIRDGIGADGEPFDPLMPRYPLDDRQLDLLVAYLKTLNTAPDPGVDDKTIHFATIVSDGVEPARRKAFLDVLEAFFAQKNVETRNESRRAAHAPRHKAWAYEPYRKWDLHVWTLAGAPESWPAQLAAEQAERPVFAVISGLVDGPWQPVHDFCEAQALPCLFPSTDLPATAAPGFYTVYLSRGLGLEADVATRHLADEGLLDGPLVQVYRANAPRSQAPAERFAAQVRARGGDVTEIAIPAGAAPDADRWQAIAGQAAGGVLVAWLDGADLQGLWASGAAAGLRRLYLSTALYGETPGAMPAAVRERARLVHAHALPAVRSRLLVRSTGWLRAKGVYAPQALREQANAFFALSLTGGALRVMRGFFVRDYLIEKLEHMTENATYTSIYERTAIAPGQRFASHGAYITRFDPAADDALIAVTDWIVPQAD